MKVRPSIKRFCQKCCLIKRHRKIFIKCRNLKHKQKQKHK